MGIEKLFLSWYDMWFLCERKISGNTGLLSISPGGEGRGGGEGGGEARGEGEGGREGGDIIFAFP